MDERLGPLHDLTRVHRSAVHRALEELIDGDQPVPVVEDQASEDLALVARVVHGEVLANCPRVGGLLAHLLEHPALDDPARRDACNRILTSGGTDSSRNSSVRDPR